MAECDTKLARYRAALEAGTDPAIVNEWITEVTAQRAVAEARLRQHHTGANQRLTRDQIRYLVSTLTGIAQVIHNADPRDKTEIYRELGIRLTYHPGQSRVLAEATPRAVCVKSVSED